MKVLFLEIDTASTWALASVGPAFIAAELRRHGHEALLARVGVDADVGACVEIVEHDSPDLVALSLTARQWTRAREVVSHIRSTCDVPVVAGGLLPTFAPEEVLDSDGFDCVCIGEGEHAMLDLLAALAARDPRREILNIWHRGGARPSLRPPVPTLDDLSFMARDFLDEHHGVAHMVTGRGCPFSCSYCSARSLGDLFERGAYLRRRSVQNIIDELSELREAGPLNYVIFLDDTFTSQARWVDEFCCGYMRWGGVAFSIHARADTVSPRMIERLAAAGCRHIVYGVESGSPRVRRDILGRGMSDQCMIDAFAATKAAGILATANYMFGIPGETAEDVEATLALNEKLAPDDFGWFVYHPYPGTRLYEECLSHGRLPPGHLRHTADNRSSVLDLSDLSRSDIEYFSERFEAARAGRRVGTTDGERPVPSPGGG